MAVKKLAHGPAMDTELLGKLQHMAARLLLGNQVSLLGICQAPLGLERFGGLNVPIIGEKLGRITLEEPVQCLTLFRIVS